MIIDHWILTLMLICSHSGMGVVIQLFPELTVSPSSDDAVVVSGTETDVRLTGSIDCAVWATTKSVASKYDSM